MTPRIRRCRLIWFTDTFGQMPRFKGGAAKTGSWEKIALAETSELWQDLFVYYTNLHLTKMESGWKNLPETCNARVLEKTYYFYGKQLFFNDTVVVTSGMYPMTEQAGALYWHTPVMLKAGFNIYGEHTKYTAYSYKYNKDFDITNSVLLRNDPQAWPFYLTVMLFCDKITEALRTTDVCAENMQFPYIIKGDAEDEKSAQIFFDKVKRHQRAILVSKSWSDFMEILPLPQAGSGTALTTLWDHVRNYENMLLTRLGEDNKNSDKKERLVVAEATANDQNTSDSIDIMVKQRQQDCEKINNMFGLNISYELEVPENGPVLSDPNGASPDVRK